jgi:universal stress protein E
VFDGLIDHYSAQQRPPVVELACRALIEEYDHKLRALAAELASPHYSIEYDVIWAPVAHEAILGKAIELGASCVVKDVHRESVLRRALFTPLDWKLIRLLPCDLMLVGPQSPPRPSRVLAAVDVLAEQPQDGAGLNSRIVASAQALAEYSSARLDLVSVAPWFPITARSAAHSARQYDEMVASHLSAFRSFAERYEVPSERRHRVLGAPAEAIARIADELSVDVTVVGNVYRNSWERLLLGSTVETLLQQLKSDLLVVKPHDFLSTTRRHIDLEAVRARLAAEQPGQAQREAA